jgi:hypothetical protein
MHSMPLRRPINMSQPPPDSQAPPPPHNRLKRDGSGAPETAGVEACTLPFSATGMRHMSITSLGSEIRHWWSLRGRSPSTHIHRSHNICKPSLAVVTDKHLATTVGLASKTHRCAAKATILEKPALSSLTPQQPRTGTHYQHEYSERQR